MKCENCGKNEVTFISRSEVNGQVEEHCLCSACAQKLGYTQRFAQDSRTMMQHFFGQDGLWNGGLFREFFSMPSLMERMLEHPFDDCFSAMPALSATNLQENEANRQTVRTQDDLVDQADQRRFSYLRQHNALRMELKKAVHQEEFERAAQLRDQIRQLEADHKAQKEQ